MLNMKLKQLFALLIFLFFPYLGQAEICTPVQKIVKYRVSQGDHLASILRYLKFEPIFCRECSLPQLLRSNHIENQNQIYPGQMLEISFKCEEDLKHFQITDQKEYRQLMVPRQVASVKNWTNKSSSVLQNDKQSRTKVYLVPQGPNYVGTGFVVAAEVNNVQIENGKNNWYKIDCKGFLVDGQCVAKLDSHYVKFKNKYLTFDFEDYLRHETYNLSSWLNPGVELGLVKYLTRQWSLLASMDIVYENVKSSRYAIEPSKNIFVSGLVDARYQIAENYYGLGLMAAEENYFVPTGTKIDAETDHLLYLRLLFGHTWFSAADNGFVSEVSLSSSGPGSGSLDPKASQIFTVKNEFVMKHDQGYYTLGADVIRHEQNTKLTHQADWELSLAAGMGWFF